MKLAIESGAVVLHFKRAMFGEQLQNRHPYFNITDDKLNEMSLEELQDLLTRVKKELTE